MLSLGHAVVPGVAQETVAAAPGAIQDPVVAPETDQDLALRRGVALALAAMTNIRDLAPDLAADLMLKRMEIPTAKIEFDCLCI